MNPDNNDTRPVILWISPGGLLPVAGGGSARTWALIDFLRENGFQVHLLTGNQGKHHAALEARVDRLWIRDSTRAGTGRRSRKKRFFSWLRHRYRALDPGLRWFYRINAWCGRGRFGEENTFVRNRRRSLETFTGEVAYMLRPDVAIASYVWLAPALDHVPPGTLRIIDTIDIQHARNANARAAGGDLSHITCTREEEQRELARADVLLGIQEEEANALRDLCPEAAVVLAQHACAVPPYTPSPEETRELLYVGNLYDPNIRGLRLFLNKLWPPIRQACPEATLTVCGRVGESVRRVPPGVIIAGRVADLAPYYARAAVVLNPVPYGTGLKIKTVEGLAAGRCVVCSEAGVGGLGDPASLPLIVADPTDDMATQILRVLNDVPLRHDYERRAHAFATENFSGNAVYGALLTRLQQHVSDRKKDRR